MLLAKEENSQNHINFLVYLTSERNSCKAKNSQDDPSSSGKRNSKTVSAAKHGCLTHFQHSSPRWRTAENCSGGKNIFSLSTVVFSRKVLFFPCLHGFSSQILLRFLGDMTDSLSSSRESTGHTPSENAKDL